MIENVVGNMNVPIGIATNLKIDGEDVLVPMATENPRWSRPSATPRARITTPASRRRCRAR